MAKTPLLRLASVVLCVAAGTAYVTKARAETDFAPTNAAQFQSALNVSQTDNDDDVITLQGHAYLIANNGGNPFKYVAANTEAHSLTIVGAGAGQTVIAGALNGQLMTLDTTGVVGDIDTTITIRGMTFFHGNVTGGGGGLLVHTTDADVVLTDCLFDRNESLSGGPDPLDGGAGGAGLASEGVGNFVIAGNVFLANQSEDSGGGLVALSFHGDATVRGNLFHGNSSQFAGGLAVEAFTGNTDVFNNVFDQNSAGVEAGGAAILASSVMNIVQNDFYDNSASLGGGLVTGGSSASVLSLYNNVFADNGAIPGSGKDVYVGDSGTPLDARVFHNLLSEYCDAANATCDLSTLGDNQGGNLIAVDPLFVDPANGDFHLQPGSPAINAGDPQAPSLPEKDIEGNPRVDGPAPDLGALETVGACGDGVVETGEECDAGADNNDTTPDACRTTCKNPACGDGVIDTGEICDDGNTTDGDDCPATCQTEEAPGSTGGTTTGGTGTAGTTGGGGGKGGCSLIRN